MRPALIVLSTLALTLVAGVPAAVGKPATPAAATGHPRLLVRASDLPRLRSWASSKNPIYARGLRTLALTARGRMDAGNVPGEDEGGTKYDAYPTELYAELFAFMALVDPDPKARDDWGQRARTLIMYVIDRALAGPGTETDPFRDPTFSTQDRSRFYGEGFGLALDWAYRYFSSEDKGKIRTVFLRWAREQYDGYPLNQPETFPRGTRPTLTGKAGDRRLLRNRTSVRWAVNNYYLAHARNLGLMAMAFDPADDPGSELRRNIRAVTGQWLFIIDHALRTDAAGGLSPEGFEYGSDAMGRLAQLLYAQRTAGEAGGRPTRIDGNRFWKDSITALLASLPTRPERPTGDDAYLGTLFRPAWFGDGEVYYAPDPIPLMGPLGLDAAERGDKRTLNATRWIVKNVPQGGREQLIDRVGGRTDNFFGAILYFLLLDPRAKEPTDPRKGQPLTHIAPGIDRILARTCWCADERLFTYMLAWTRIDHQRGDGNDFSFLRRGEWLTRVRVGYSNPATDFHNTLTIENDPLEGDPQDFSVLGNRLGGQYGFVPGGDPKPLALLRGRGYTYALGDATKLYNSTYYKLGDVKHASRSIVWLEPDHIVVYDRAETGKAGRFKRFWLQVPGEPQVAGDRVTVRTPRGQQLFVTTLEPTNPTIRGEASPDVGYPAAGESMNFRFSVEATGAPKSVRFLHVLQGADANASPSQAVAIRSSNGTPFEGAAVAGTAVLFPVNLGSVSGFTVDLPGGVRRVLVTGLKAGGGYTASRDGDILRVSAGGSMKANRAGVLEVGS